MRPSCLGAGHRGTGLGAGAGGQCSTLRKYGRGCPSSQTRAWPLPGSLFPINQSHLFWCERGTVSSIPSERRKESSITKKPLCISHRSQRKAPGKREGRSRRRLADLSTNRSSSRSLGNGPAGSKPKPPHAMCKAGATAPEALSKAAPQTKALRLPLHSNSQLPRWTHVGKLLVRPSALA